MFTDAMVAANDVFKFDKILYKPDLFTKTMRDEIIDFV